MAQKQELKQNWMKGYDVVIGEDVETVITTDFSELLGSTSVSKNFEEGEVFMGTIINIGQDYVTVDIGYKQEGLVSVKEFQNYDGSLKIKAGDLIEVYLEKLESNMGNLNPFEG
jgi:small subunit ribosomal protein S1